MEELNQLRLKIDEVDEQILQLLAKRVKVCEAIGATKKAKGVPVKDTGREAEIFKRVREKAAKLAVSPAQVEAVYREIVNMCSSVQE
jgi:chorismate mutase-like protein